MANTLPLGSAPSCTIGAGPRSYDSFPASAAVSRPLNLAGGVAVANSRPPSRLGRRSDEQPFDRSRLDWSGRGRRICRGAGTAMSPQGEPRRHWGLGLRAALLRPRSGRNSRKSSTKFDGNEHCKHRYRKHSGPPAHPLSIATPKGSSRSLNARHAATAACAEPGLKSCPLSAVAGVTGCCAVHSRGLGLGDSSPTGGQDSPVCSVIRSAAASMATYVGLKPCLGCQFRSDGRLGGTCCGAG